MRGFLEVRVGLFGERSQVLAESRPVFAGLLPFTIQLGHVDVLFAGWFKSLQQRLHSRFIVSFGFCRQTFVCGGRSSSQADPDPLFLGCRVPFIYFCDALKCILSYLSSCIFSVRETVKGLRGDEGFRCHSHSGSAFADYANVTRVIHAWYEVRRT